VIPDYVWLSAAAKFKAIRERLQSQSRGRMIVLVAHFPNLLKELEQLADDFDATRTIAAYLAHELSPAAAHEFLPQGSDAVDLVVAERHPLASPEAALLRFAEALPCRSSIEYHVSLDDPFMLHLGADSIRRWMGRMGAEEAETISHRLITQSIHKAQVKLERESLGRADADSAAEWIARNTRRSASRRSADGRSPR
jgi:hypothetical protein